MEIHLKRIKKDDLTPVKKIKVFGVKNASPLVWDYEDPNTKLGAVIKNNVILLSQKVIKISIKEN